MKKISSLALAARRRYQAMREGSRVYKAVRYLLLLIAAAYLLLLIFPQVLFAHQITRGRMTVYSREPLDQNIYSILDAVEAKISASGLDSSFVSASSAQQQSARSRPLALTHVTVIDVTGAPAKPDRTVVIEGDRIREIGASREVKAPKGAVVIDATDKFLIPGLWDMHAHPMFSRRQFFPLFALHLYIANGVTGIRDMFGPLDEEKQWRKAIDVGAIIGPRIFIGPLVDGPQPVFPGSIAVSNEEEGRKAVRDLKGRGADFIKVYDLLPRAAYFAIADESRLQGIAFAGHVPMTVSALEASDAGQKSIEHLGGVLESCSSIESALTAERIETNSEKDFARAVRALLRITIKAVDTYDPKKAASLFARFVKNGTYMDPTLVAYPVEAGLADPNDPRLKYIPAAMKDEWSPEKNSLYSAMDAEDMAQSRRLFEKHLELVGAMRRAGVEFLIGTDAPAVPYCFPGFSVHDEMALLARSGLTLMEALQAATINPARFLGLADRLGTVEKGKIADLVLLDANPLDDIRNTRKIAAVILRGKLLPKESLEKMLADVEAASAKK